MIAIAVAFLASSVGLLALTWFEAAHRGLGGLFGRWFGRGFWRSI